MYVSRNIKPSSMNQMELSNHLLYLKPLNYVQTNKQ